MLLLEEMSVEDMRSQIIDYLNKERSDNAYISLITQISSKYYKSLLDALNRLYAAQNLSNNASDSIVDAVAEINDESIIKDIEILAEVETLNDLFSAVDMDQFATKYSKEFSENIAKILYDLVSLRVFDKLAEELIKNIFDDNDIKKIYDLYKLTEPEDSEQESEEEHDEEQSDANQTDNNENSESSTNSDEDATET